MQQGLHFSNNNFDKHLQLAHRAKTTEIVDQLCSRSANQAPNKIVRSPALRASNEGRTSKRSRAYRSSPSCMLGQGQGSELGWKGHRRGLTQVSSATQAWARTASTSPSQLGSGSGLGLALAATSWLGTASAPRLEAAAC